MKGGRLFERVCDMKFEGDERETKIPRKRESDEEREER